MDYTIVMDTDVTNFMRCIKEMLNEHWEFQGSLVIFKDIEPETTQEQYDKGSYHHCYYFAQPMTRAAFYSPLNNLT